MATTCSAKLDEAQMLAACHGHGPAICLAGPGAGKTRVIAHRVALLIDYGVQPPAILCLAFSVAAAKELRLRISKMTGVPQQKLANTVSTFHSQALRIINAEREHLGFELQPNPILLPGGAVRTIRRLFPGQDPKDLRAEFGKMRRGLNRTDEMAEYQAWDQWLRENGMLDFDSMVFFAVELLESNHDVRRRWQEKFEHVIVDEAHDTSLDQKRFAEILSALSGNLFSVGDPSQRIYSWRGASNELLHANGTGAKVYYLAANYRSTAEIVDTFRPYADEEAKTLAEQMRAVREDVGIVRTFGFASDEAQAAQVAIAAPESSSAVLARTRALLAPVADALEDRGVRYVWNGKNFWAQREVKQVLAFARLALNGSDANALKTALCSQAQCARYLGSEFARRVLADGGLESGAEWASSGQRYSWWDFRSAIHAIRGYAAFQVPVFFRMLLNRAGFGPGADDEPDSFGDENIYALQRRAERFQTIHGLLDHARRMEHAKSRTGVVLSTIHSAKGLEWENVFLIGVSEGLLPHAKSRDLTEERRVFYVGLSRARTNLWISYHGKPSPFLRIAEANASAGIVAENDPRSVR